MRGKSDVVSVLAIALCAVLAYSAFGAYMLS